MADKGLLDPPASWIGERTRPRVLVVASRDGAFSDRMNRIFRILILFDFVNSV
jgi:hypothetical protein